MRICLTTTTFPPEGIGGIPRQRQVLAHALAQLGHEVHIITQGPLPGSIKTGRIFIHIEPHHSPSLVFSHKYVSVNDLLTHSQAIWERVITIQKKWPFDILDIPLWGLEGLVPLCANEIPVALWLQTSRAQVMLLDENTSRLDDLGIIMLEKECLIRANGLIADSKTLLSDFERIYQLNDLKERSNVVSLGLPDISNLNLDSGKKRDYFEILVVGRLEKRKGTEWLIEILPKLLNKNKRLKVSFIGADNSRWDGFQDKTKMTYPEFFSAHWPRLANRVSFIGPVSEDQLNQAYQRADILLVPSLYESFGLIYLEAMRACLPVITFDLGAVREIFPKEQYDGAIIVPPKDEMALISAVLELAENKNKRLEIGRCGRYRFLSNFTDDQMAQKTVKSYQSILDASNHRRPKISRKRHIFQVMEALDVGDAVSQIALRNAELLKDIGFGGSILSMHAHPEIAEKIRPIQHFDPNANIALIFHYWNYSYLDYVLYQFRGPKAIHFHNITPPRYFPLGSQGYISTSRGYQQLPRVINMADLLIGDSAYNLEVCKPYLNKTIPSFVVPPVFDTNESRNKPYDKQLLYELRRLKGTKILFVGRIARNKRQDRLIELFNHYYCWVNNNAWLFLVGSDQSDPTFRIELEAFSERLPSKERIIFTGKISDEQLQSYYHAADVFVSASEHEGFGMPLIHAMTYDLPVLAYAVAAVPETLGKSGILINKWHTAKIAELIQLIQIDSNFRKEILLGQRNNLKRFTSEKVKESLKLIIQHLVEKI